MFYLICYDIANARRLRRVARIMEGYGARVQKSVFECELDAAGHARLLARVGAVLDEKTDSVRVYPLCRACRRTRAAYGCHEVTDAPDFYLG